MDQSKKPPNPKPVSFVKKYKHYLTGKVMIAEEYGYTVWPIHGKKKK